nr:iron chelate uptake ABC transporter family permease subunit [Corynebacterium diphtheriae]
MRFWRAGSVTGRGFDIIVPALLPLGVGALLALAMGPTLNVFNLGAEAAQALGTNVGRANALGLVAITLLAGAATAAAGPIGFVGLVARSITGPDYKWVLPYSGLAGACLLLLADIIGRLVMRPGELQAGIVIALIGAPAFIWLVRHRKLVSI